MREIVDEEQHQPAELDVELAPPCEHCGELHPLRLCPWLGGECGEA